MSSLLCAFVVHFKLVCVCLHTLQTSNWGCKNEKLLLLFLLFLPFIASLLQVSRGLWLLCFGGLIWLQLPRRRRLQIELWTLFRSLFPVPPGWHRVWVEFWCVCVCCLGSPSCSPSLVVIVVLLITHTHTHTVCTKCGYKVSPLLEKAIRFSSPPSTTTIFSLVCSSGVQACLFVCLFGLWSFMVGGCSLRRLCFALLSQAHSDNQTVRRRRRRHKCAANMYRRKRVS